MNRQSQTDRERSKRWETQLKDQCPKSRVTASGMQGMVTSG